MTRTSARSLRSTLTLWLELGAVGALLVLCAGLVLTRRSSYREEQDAALAADAGTLVTRLLEAGAGEEGAVRPSSERLCALLPFASADAPCALRSGDGDVLVACNLPEAELLPAVAGPAARGPLQPAFATLLAAAKESEPATLRVVPRRFVAGERLYFLQLARRERSWLGSLRALVLPLACGALALGLAARLVADLIARRALSPLRALADVARTFSPSNLGGRLRVQHADAELRSLEEELNAALERMEEGYLAQAHFAGNVAHELKTPIAALVADAQVTGLERQDPERARAFMNRAEAELKHLSSLVESLLVMARVDSRQVRADLVYVDDVVRRAARHCQGLADELKVGLRLELAGASADCDPFVRGDAQLLQALVENLIRNAVHHSPHDAEVAIETACTRSEVRVTVRDRGPGIAVELRDAVFERGVRSAIQARRSSGAGLGLAIVHDIARLHRGSVAVEENESGGTSIVVTLPMNGAPRANGPGA